MAVLSVEQHAVNRVFSHGEKIIIFMSCAAAAKESNGKYSICPAEKKIFFFNFSPTARPISNTIHRLAEPLSNHLKVKAAVSAKQWLRSQLEASLILSTADYLSGCPRVPGSACHKFFIKFLSERCHNVRAVQWRHCLTSPNLNISMRFLCGWMELEVFL